MTKPRLPDNYRFKVTPAPFQLGARVKLQRHLFWKFWETVDEGIPIGGDPIENRVDALCQQMWRWELRRLADRAYFTKEK